MFSQDRKEKLRTKQSVANPQVDTIIIYIIAVFVIT